jgi:probable rRNA maturation factor
MSVLLLVRNESRHKRLYRTDDLRHLAERICDAERVRGDAELSLLLCDDAFITELNRTYRRKNATTDVLAFGQVPEAERFSMRGVSETWPLGDIVISLETVARRCASGAVGVPRRKAMRQELRLLFCHGLLHLLGSEHATEEARAEMNAKQARYLGVTEEAAWHSLPKGSRLR